MLARYGVCVGQRAVLFGNHDRLYATAARLRAGGMQIAAVVDVRPIDLIGRTPGAPEVSAGNGSRDRNDALTLRESLLADGVECLAHHAVISAHGRLAVRAAQIAPLAGTVRER
jgi:hypothetical protein